jgi:AcrR family transcriptional regulator
VTVPQRERRDELLNAAEQVLSRGGPEAMTLQAVADEAQVSKGGLLYHFSSKSELVRGLVERLVEDMNSNYARWDDGKPGSYTRAYIAATCHHLTAADSSQMLRRWSVILAASTERDMLGQISEAFKGWMLPASAVDRYPERAQIARLAADGLWWNAMFINVFRDPELNSRISAALVDYAEDRDCPEE